MVAVISVIVCGVTKAARANFDFDQRKNGRCTVGETHTYAFGQRSNFDCAMNRLCTLILILFTRLGKVVNLFGSESK
jgi:hypothetical protein